MFPEKSPKCSRNKSQSTSNCSTIKEAKGSENIQECQLCYMKYEHQDEMYTLFNCKHSACRVCLESYLTIEITESRTDIGEDLDFIARELNINVIFKLFLACPQCTDPMHPSDIQVLLKPHPNVISKYEGNLNLGL